MSTIRVSKKSYGFEADSLDVGGKEFLLQGEIEGETLRQMQVRAIKAGIVVVLGMDVPGITDADLLPGGCDA